MALEKLRTELQQVLPEKGINELNELQTKAIDLIKSGKNVTLEAHDGSGKTTTLLLAVLQKIQEAGEGSPRAIVVCATDQKAIELHAQFERICRLLDLTVDLAHDKGNMLQQRNDIFDGTEIIVGTPRRLYDLYIQNGFNVGKIKLFVLDDLIDLFRNGHKMQISRIAESLPKCQHLLASHSFKDRRIEEYMDEFVPVSVSLEAE